MLLALSGGIHADCDQLSLTLPIGGLLLAPPGSRPRFCGEPEAKGSAITFCRSLIDAFASESALSAAVEGLSSPTPALAVLEPFDFREARELFESFERLEAQPRPGYGPILRLKVMELLLLLGARRSDVPSPGLGEPRFRAEELMRFIDERYADRLSLESMAARFGLNPSYLSRAFSAQTGSTIVEYVNRVRIRKSCVLLKRSAASVLDIALSVGYNSLSHFNHFFRRTMGISPREYRRQSQR